MFYRNIRKHKCFVLAFCMMTFLLGNYFHRESVHDDKFITTTRKTRSIFSPDRKVHNICRTLFARNVIEQSYLKYLTENFTKPFKLSGNGKHELQSCDEYVQKAGFIRDAVNSGEESFPLAYSIMSYKDSHQVIRLLRAIYRPQNIYCIHVDKKASYEMFNSIVHVADCFDNVLVLPTRIDVQWGYYSVLEPEMMCMEELWMRHTKWRYFINLTGQEFPLKTNYELVQMLRAYNGANDIEGTIQRANEWRYNNETPPHGLRLVKGAVHILASRGFVDYLMTSRIARDFLVWNRNKFHPDEIYFSTMNHNPQLNIPGTYKGDPDEKDDNFRYKVWSGDGECAGQFKRAVCILGIGDLPRLIRAPQPFANKFYYNYQPLAYDCIEDWYFSKVRLEMLGKSNFNNSLYKKFRFVQNKV